MFIFSLAVFHVVCSIITLAFGRDKMKEWKAWQIETQTMEDQYTHDLERFRLPRDTTFGQRHLSVWCQSTILVWMVCVGKIGENSIFHKYRKIIFSYFGLKINIIK
ncbi:hypothetical protein Hanom_Chr02g00160641 [Helianthus anomalus]